MFLFKLIANLTLFLLTIADFFYAGGRSIEFNIISRLPVESDI